MSKAENFQTRLERAKARGHRFADRAITYNVGAPGGGFAQGHRANCLDCGRAVFTEGPYGYSAENRDCEPKSPRTAQLVAAELAQKGDRGTVPISDVR